MSTIYEEILDDLLYDVTYCKNAHNNELLRKIYIYASNSNIKLFKKIINNTIPTDNDYINMFYHALRHNNDEIVIYLIVNNKLSIPYNHILQHLLNRNKKDIYNDLINMHM
jgi:hypothetical protein